MQTYGARKGATGPYNNFARLPPLLRLAGEDDDRQEQVGDPRLARCPGALHRAVKA